MPSPTSIKGDAAEQLAVEHLQGLGFAIIQRNYRTRGGEIDIIALDGATLCFVEVRSRKSATHGDPLETVGWAKQRRIVTAARQYMTSQGQQDREIRFDVVGILMQPELRIQLVKGAFEPGWAC